MIQIATTVFHGFELPIDSSLATLKPVQPKSATKNWKRLARTKGGTSSGVIISELPKNPPPEISPSDKGRLKRHSLSTVDQGSIKKCLVAEASELASRDLKLDDQDICISHKVEEVSLKWSQPQSWALLELSGSGKPLDCLPLERAMLSFFILWLLTLGVYRKVSVLHENHIVILLL